MNPNQILAIIYLLLAFGVPQPTVDTVQGILQRATTTSVQSVPLSAPISSPVQTGIGEVGAPACVDNPILTLTESSSTSNSVTLTGKYVTGCDISPNLKWTYKTDSWNKTGNKVDYNYGVIGHSNEWSLQGPEGQTTYDTGYFSMTIVPYSGQKIVTLTIGNTVATTSIVQ